MNSRDQKGETCPLRFFSSPVSLRILKNANCPRLSCLGGTGAPFFQSAGYRKPAPTGSPPRFLRQGWASFHSPPPPRFLPRRTAVPAPFTPAPDTEWGSGRRLQCLLNQRNNPRPFVRPVTTAHKQNIPECLGAGEGLGDEGRWITQGSSG